MIAQPKNTIKKNVGYTTCFLLCIFTLLLSIFNVKAQTYLTNNNLSGTQAAGEYYHSSSITLSPSFSFTATSGNSLHLYITGQDCIPLATAPSSNQNYIITSTPRKAGYDPAVTTYTSCDVMQTIQYFDGLGRPLQTVTVKGNPNATRDMIQPFEYDAFGREAKKRLPYTDSLSSPGSYRSNALSSEQSAFYGLTGKNYKDVSTPFAQTIFEASPLNRVTEQGAPGDPWQPLNGSITGSGHTSKLVYTSNNDTTLTDTAHTRQVALYTATVNSNGSRTLGRVGNSATYPANQLYVTISKDENWTGGRAGTTEEYKDKEGHVVLKRTFNYKSGTLEILSTYYVYDDLDQLAFVLPSGANPDAATAITQTTLNNLCYQYRYDERNRLTQKKLPGKGWELMVYNALDQVVLTQDSIQRLSNQWEVSKYDALGRTIITGLWNAASAISQSTLQASIYSGAQWDNRDNTGNTTTYPTGYVISSYPSTLSNILAVNYYDDYNIPDLPVAYDQHSSYSSMTRGLATASSTAILLPNGDVSSDRLLAVHYYDDKGRSVKTFQQHYLGSTVSPYNYDEISSSYDFTNAVTTTIRKHYAKNSGNTAAILAVTIADSLVYDHLGRKIESWSKINGDSNTLISKTVYNEVGQAYTKRLHSTNGTSFLQDVVYTYNERGWLNAANSSGGLFNLELKYNTPATGVSKQYNGNISQMLYSGTYSGSKTFSYAYDQLNRLTNAASTGGTLDETIAYDSMGNISQLVRGGSGMGTLNYTSYTGNQLNTVTGYSPRTYAYDGNGNATSEGGNKGIDYNMLNLPRKISQSGNILASYTYDAGGNKLNNVSTSYGMNDGTWEYINGIVYHNSTIAFISTEEGRATPSGGGSYKYEYNLKDHLGNDRLSFSSNTGTATVLQEDEYYSFGLRKGLYDNSNNNRYLYNGKEIQTDLANQYDYGARFYDPVIGRWTTIDPEVEAGQEIATPYGYVYDDPIKNTDPDGKVTKNDPPSALSVTGNFVKGLGQSVWGTVTGVVDLVRNPMPTITALSKYATPIIGNAMLQEDISNAVSQDVNKFKNGNGDVKANMLGNLVGNVAQLFIGVEDIKAASEALKVSKGVDEAGEAVKITEAYKRPNNATTPEQRASVQNKPCVKCGATDGKRIAGHKKALVKEYYETGKIDKKRMRDVNAVQSECATCSAKEGAETSKYSKEQKKLNGLH